MGFSNYLIYKFLKNFIKKHKFITIIILLFIIYLIFSHKCFAVEQPVSSLNNIPTPIVDRFNTLRNTYSPNDYYYSIRQDITGGKNYFGILVINKNTNFNLYRLQQSNFFYLQCSSSFKAMLFNYYPDGSLIYQTTNWDYTNGAVRYYNVDTYFYCDFPIYNDSSLNSYYFEPVDPYIRPSFITTVSEFEDFVNLQYIEINPGSFEDSLYFRAYNDTTNTLLFNDKITKYEDYIEREDIENPFSDLIYRIPINVLPSFNLVANNDYELRLVYYNENNVLSNVSLFFTADTNQNVNNITNNDINNNIDTTNQKIEDLQNSITDSNIDSDITSDLPSVNVQNPTETGLDTLFTNIYNAFCTGTPQDIVFPIPFTNKNITLSPYYIRNSLVNSNSGWLITLIETFWTFLFGSFIVRDISKKIRKNQIW